MNNKRIAIFVAALVLMIISILSFSDNVFSPYVDFKYAKNHPHKLVQIIGATDRNTITMEEKGFSFSLINENNEKIKIFHRGVKPLNFEHAEKIVLIGQYKKDKFETEKMLVKCPSKYTEKK